jgi:hypothetical protein
LTETCDYRNIGRIMEPANTIITICGGFSAVAEMLDMTEIQVRRWTYPKERGGSGGLVPSGKQSPLLAAAKSKGINLTPGHFFGEVA